MSLVETQAANPRERLARQKARLNVLREKARERYKGGSSGLQVAALISEMIDTFLVELFEESLSTLGLPREEIAQQLAMVAIGGSGRGALAPYSDADILFLHRPGAPRGFEEGIAQMVRDCWDAGIKLGHSVRTISDTLNTAMNDPHLATAVVEARRLWGDERLVETLKFRFKRRLQRRYARFYRECLASRAEEQGQAGASDRQLEPDVKRSAGGLRDVHLIRWIGFANYGTSDPDLLRLEGALSLDDAIALSAGEEFLTRVRTNLHFQAGKAQDILSREEQLRLAEYYGFEATPVQRPVERFMQTYFRHSTAISDVVARFMARHRPMSLWARAKKLLLSHRSNELYVVSREIDVPRRRRTELTASLEQMLNLHELAGLYGVEIAPDVVEDMRLAVPNLPRTVSPRTGQIFLSIMDQTGHVGRLLRSLYRTGLLEVVLPEFTHTRCLLQFNQYHAFTVDEHSIRAVEAAERFHTEPGPIGEVYRSLKSQQLLHLALLLHDLGKGFEEDHSDVGLRMADAVATRLDLPGPAREMLMFLVHKHLILSLVAFRRDLTDPAVIANFARDVGSPERLKMLYVMTAADMIAVGPNTWTEWKAELTTDLYRRTLPVLGGRPADAGSADRLSELERTIARIGRDLAGRSPESPAARILNGELHDRLKTFPEHYLAATPPEQIAADLQDVSSLSSQQVIVRSRYVPATNTVEYRVVTRDRAGSGLFSKMTGAMTAKRLEILSANICTTTDGVIVDNFQVHDGDHAGEIPEFRVREIEAAIRDVVTGATTVEDLFQRHTRFQAKPDTPLSLAEPTRVVVDNDSSERCTVIDVFAIDRPGLLYTIAATLFELELSVLLAKIGSHVDQVLDVFYVTDRGGGKVHDPARLDHIRRTLEQRLHDFERKGQM